MDDAATPTNETFASSALAAQKPLPSTFSDFPEPPQAADSPNDKPLHSHGDNSHGARKSRDPSEMNVDDSDGEMGHGDDAAGLSDEESIAADGKANKKKKSLRFYCTDYPPCNLSFTRSEHLARHIRKHTGERPFQCHCSRRFSRLDNLRQHAQTVHVNEDIPMDSLAATGTRFQRQIRTDRVRATTGRARATTAGSMGTPVRGHSKSLSTSSITSVSSVTSSVFSPRDDMRRRPPPLVMADPRSATSYRSSALDNQYRPLTPTDYASPPSATFSNGPGSPHWGHAIVSPSPSHNRAQSMYVSGVRTPGRRLSVPSSTTNPFQSPQNATFGRALFSPGSMNASNSGLFSPLNAGNALASPTTSTTSTWSRRDSTSTVSDEAWRRRTWHPDTREYNAINNSSAAAGGSHLSHVISSSQYQTPPTANVPLANPAAQHTNLRLPGIESFDPIPRHRPGSPPRRAPSPMAIDPDNALVTGPPTSILRVHHEPIADDRRTQINGQWDMPLHRNLTRLEIASGTSPRDGTGAWVSEASHVVMAQAEQSFGNAHQRQLQPSVRFEDDVRAPPPRYGGPDSAPTGYNRGHYHTVSAPSFNVSTPRHQKRQGWYQGPPPSVPAIDAERVSGPRVDRMVHPNLASGFQGFPAHVPQTVHEHRQQAAPQPLEPQRYSHSQQEQDSPDSLRRLEALVAVATSEVSTAAAY